MRLLASHVVLMATYACLTGAFFALLSRDERRARLKIFAIIAGSLLLGGVIAAWIMYPFPIR